jgi:hypothetical protein
MRAVFAAILLMSGSPVCDADDIGARVPAGTEVIAELYQFDLFQQNAIETADRTGSEALRHSAVGKAEAATQRNKALLELQRKTGTQVNISKAAARRADRVAELDSAAEPSAVREFYQAEVAQHRSTVLLLQRYLSAPDNDEIKDFVADQLPALQSGLSDAEAVLASKDE